MLTINMDDTVKKEFSQVVSELGLNATTAINLFARAVIREKGIPFSITLRTKEEQVWNDYLNSEFRKGLDDLAAGRTLTLDELRSELASKEVAPDGIPGDNSAIRS